jgi:ribonucleotide reductase alpha subunit
VINRYLIDELEKRNLWNPQIRLKLLADNGSVQGIAEIPDDVKMLFRTVWEIPQKSCIEMAADRGAFICQSQSMNLYIADPSVGKISSALFYAWQKGLKTGSYYLRSKSRREAVNVTVELAQEAQDGAVCSIDNPDCEVCSS